METIIFLAAPFVFGAVAVTLNDFLEIWRSKREVEERGYKIPWMEFVKLHHKAKKMPLTRAEEDWLKARVFFQGRWKR